MNYRVNIKLIRNRKDKIQYYYCNKDNSHNKYHLQIHLYNLQFLLPKTCHIYYIVFQLSSHSPNTHSNISITRLFLALSIIDIVGHLFACLRLSIFNWMSCGVFISFSYIINEIHLTIKYKAITPSVNMQM